jgi:hypothetical protein
MNLIKGNDMEEQALYLNHAVRVKHGLTNFSIKDIEKIS